MKSFRNNLIRKAAAIMLTMLISAITLPLTANAFINASFYFDPESNEISGYLDTRDPDDFQIKIITSVSEATYSVEDDPEHFDVQPYLYDDSNARYWTPYLNDILVDSQPMSIQVSEDNGGHWTTLSFNDNKYSYPNPVDFPNLNEYRISATEDYSSVSAATYAYMQEGDILVSFTPSDDEENGFHLTYDMNAIRFDFGVNNQFDMSGITPDDFMLFDAISETNIPISEIKPYIVYGYDDEPIYSLSKLIFVASSELIHGTEYILYLSNAAEGDEIKRLPAGTYNLELHLGKHYYSSSGDPDDPDYTGIREYFIPANYHGFNNVTVSNPASGNSPVPSSTPSTDGTAITTSSDGTILTPSSDSVKIEMTADGKKKVKVSLKREDLSKAFDTLNGMASSSKKLIVNVVQEGDIIEVENPADLLADQSKSDVNTIVSIKSGSGSIDIPIRAVDYDALAKQLGVASGDVKLTVTMSDPSAEQDKKIREQAKAQNINILNIANFSVTAAGGGKSQEITNFGTTYVPRTIVVTENAAGKQLMAVIIDAATEELQFIPAKLNAKGEIVIMAPHASLYAIVEKKDVTFSDIQQHWARADIEELASRLLVKGTAADTFSPEKQISRSEFTVLIARALGLEMKKSDSPFSDVDASSWYAEAVKAAVQAGIVKGRTDTSFAPNATITREEMSVMLARALAFVGQPSDVSAKQASLLGAFADNSSISGWAQASVAQAVDAKVLRGDKQGNFYPQANATRAEAVSTLKRLLDYIKFIN